MSRIESFRFGTSERLVQIPNLGVRARVRPSWPGQLSQLVDDRPVAHNGLEDRPSILALHAEIAAILCTATWPECAGVRDIQASHIQVVGGLHAIFALSRLQKRSLLVTADDVVSVLGNSATTTQYADSKRAILSYVASKSGSPSRDPSTKFVACTPGFCNTNLGAPFLPGVLYSVLAPFRWLLLRDSTEGAVGALKALLDTRVENGDFVDSAEVLEHLPRTRPDLFVGEAVKNWAMS